MEQATTHKHMTKRETVRVILASSVGTVFEWYDFYLYATLAPFFAVLFFPKGNYTAALLASFATYAAGFLVRPFGALVFGSLGDLIGRKYTFLMTIFFMGLSTTAVGLLPTYEAIGMGAPIILVTLRLIQGLALGGEYGGAATYVAEHAPIGKRGLHTSWIQTTASAGFIMSMLVILLCRTQMEAKDFAEWGWRIPFLLSIILFAFSLYIRLRLQESPLFLKIKEAGTTSKNPIAEAFGRWSNLRVVLLALFGATAGQGVVWYTGQFYVLFFLTITLKMDYQIAYYFLIASVGLGSFLFLFFGWLSDKIGRKPIIMTGFLLAALTYMPLFGALTHYVNPKLEAFVQNNPVTLEANYCGFHAFPTPGTVLSDCDKTKDFLTKQGISFNFNPIVNTDKEFVKLSVGDAHLEGWNEDSLKQILKDKGYPEKADPKDTNVLMTFLILFVLMSYVTMVYGPIAAYLVEIFPTRIRYTAMSLPYHIGNGWFGGLLPLLATGIAAYTGNIYYGLFYPITVAIVGFIIGMVFLKESRHRSLTDEETFHR